MSALLSISILIRLLAAGWAAFLVWRHRDWRLAFLPLMLVLMVLQPLLPGLGEPKSLMLQVSILTVIIATMFYFLLRRSLQRRAATLLRVMLISIVLYQIINLLSDDPFDASMLLHSGLSMSLIVYLNIVLLGRILSERQQAEETLRKQLKNDAVHDALTGLPNRILFMERLRLAHARAQRRSGHLFAVLFLDLDRFKLVNDSLGHAMGDLLLVQAAERIGACLRDEDIVARLGGDEFAVLIEDLKEPVDAERFALRLHEQLAQPYHLEGREIVSTASMGVALNTIDYTRPEDLLRDADTAMYQAKAAGKGRYEMFDNRMHKQAVAQLRLEADLHRAVQGGQLDVHYQPIVALDSGKIVACEALLRWNHPSLGWLRPAEFIAVAEETGQIVPIGEWVLRTACAQNKAWQLTGSLPLMNVAVNISALQLRQLEFVDTVSQILDQTSLDPHFLELELTESMLVEDSEAAARTIEQLANLGVRFAIDDFGTGYSSLSYLRRFPLHSLKIDRVFVSSLNSGDPGGAGIVAAVISLAHSLELEVTAEGVESEDQLATLRSLQCAKGQGYLFSVPLPTESITKLLQENACGAVLPGWADLGKQPQGVAGLLNLAAEVSEETAHAGTTLASAAALQPRKQQ